MSTENTSKSKKSKVQKPESPEPRQPMPITPIIVEYGLYSRDQLIVGMAIAGETIDEWVKAGLKPRNRNTKRHFFRGGDVMEIMLKDVG